MSESCKIDYLKILSYNLDGVLFRGGFQGAGDMLNSRGAFLKEILTGTNQFYCLFRSHKTQAGSKTHQIVTVGTSSEIVKAMYKRCCNHVLMRNIEMFRDVEQITPELADRGFELVEDFYFNQFLTTGVLRWGSVENMEDRVGFFSRCFNDPDYSLRNFTVTLLGSGNGVQTLSIANTEGLVDRCATMSNNPLSYYKCSFSGSYFLLLSGDTEGKISSKLNRRPQSVSGRLSPSVFCRGSEGFTRAVNTHKRREVFDMMFEDAFGFRGPSR